MLDSGALNNMAGDNYKKILNDLFSKINNTNIVQNNMVNQNIQNNISNQNIHNINNQNNSNIQNSSISEFSNTFNNETQTKIEKQVEISFWLSIVGLMLSIFGYALGIILYFYIFYLASRGMNTKKRGKAIGAIIISIISLLIILLQIFGI